MTEANIHMLDTVARQVARVYQNIDTPERFRFLIKIDTRINRYILPYRIYYEF